ncbi:MAG: hypothetical protein PF961_21485 [Planctomycetota bacterium]|jgi:hypothetical protein|nr:hypothetical protein [Planctomycetota bacterium]
MVAESVNELHRRAQRRRILSDAETCISNGRSFPVVGNAMILISLVTPFLWMKLAFFALSMVVGIGTLVLLQIWYCALTAKRLDDLCARGIDDEAAAMRLGVGRTPRRYASFFLILAAFIVLWTVKAAR